MSFEGIFENWLKTQDEEERVDENVGIPDLAQQQQTKHPDKESKKLEDEGGIGQEVWGKETIKCVCVSNKTNHFLKQEGRNIQPSSPHTLQISFSLQDVKDRQRKDLNKQSYHKDKIKTPTVENGEYSENLMVDYKHMKHNLPMEGPDHRQCHTHSALTDISDLTPNTSPANAEVLRRDLVQSPEHDSPMEPDSTSECLATSKCTKAKKKCEVSMPKMYHGREDSPCSTGFAGDATTGSKNSAVTVRVEESQAECDSTSMFLASPNAISPASQGEIEERVCPVFTDHEDGASPAHCMCQCQSLTPPVNLLPRDHVPTVTTATSASPPSLASPHITVRITSTKSCSNSSEVSSKALVSSRSCFESKANSDIEQLSPKLNLSAKKQEVKVPSETVVAVLPDKEAFGKQCATDQAESDFAVRNTASKVKKDPPACQKPQFDLLELGTDGAAASGDNHSNSLTGLEVSSKCDPKQNKVVCDFAKHIDWGTAVAETFESSTSVRKRDGESKPVIILKIRTKAVVPCLERNLEPKSLKTSLSLKRKGDSVGSPEILSRLRKRHRSEVAKSETLDCSSEERNCERHANHFNYKSKDKQQTTNTGSGCSCSKSSLTKRKRRNTVHVDGDSKAYTRHLSPSDCKFVECTSRLSRLQTQTHNLICSLFPLLRQQLRHITPESHHFTKIIDDIIGSLERSDSEEIMKEFEQLSEQFERMKVEGSDLVPVYSPQVILCSDPLHSLEDFQDKVCNLLQLLLPDLTVSLTDCLSQSPDQLEEVLKRVLLANKIKDRSARKC